MTSALDANCKGKPAEGSQQRAARGDFIRAAAPPVAMQRADWAGAGAADAGRPLRRLLHREFQERAGDGGGCQRRRWKGVKGFEGSFGKRARHTGL